MYTTKASFLESNIGAGTWEELSRAHRDLMPGPATPSGLKPKDGVPLYAFPASQRISGLGNIPDALVCQQS